MKKLLAVALGMAAASAMADITLDGATFVSSNTTVSEKVTGSGYYVVTGGATLTLANAGNDFTGGVIVSNGVIKATAERALGTGDIYLSYASGQFAQVVFAANGTYPNNIIKTGKGFPESYPSICTSGAGTDVTLTGKIAMACADMTYSDYIIFSNGSAGRLIEATTKTTFKMTITGDVDTGAGRIVLYAFKKDSSWPMCPILFKGKVKTAGIFTGWASSHQGQTYLYNPSNEIAKVNMKLFEVHLMETNVIRGAGISLCGSGQNVGAENAMFHMHGHDQIVGLIEGLGDADTDSSTWNGRTCGFYSTANQPCTLTITARSSNRAQLAVMGPVDLVIAYPEDRLDYGQYIQRRWSSTTGNVRIESGRLLLERGSKKDSSGKDIAGTAASARFSNVTNFYVGAKGQLELTDATMTFPAMKEMTVNGNVFVDSVLADDVFAADTKLRIGANAHYYIRTGCTNTVNKLYVNGRHMPAGTYTKDNAPWMEFAKNPENYAGALVVTKGPKGLRFSIR